MGEYLHFVNHTKEEVVTPTKINRGLKMYGWMSECTSSIGMYLLLNTKYSEGKEFAGLWAGDDVELLGDSRKPVGFPPLPVKYLGDKPRGTRPVPPVESPEDVNNTDCVQNYTDITEDLFAEMERELQEFPNNMDSEFAKSVLGAYKK